ncbi:MAG: hypothetical protein JW774_06565 [Candidatus Aureabacteria bacterium]|nr:hypothetical protein [Candidatus Auribacterota bacterium]
MPKLFSLIRYKALCLMNSLRELPAHSKLKVYFILFFVLGFFFSGIFCAFRAFHFLMDFSFIGNLLIERIFHVYFFVLFIMLAVSSIVMTVSSLFSSKEMEFHLVLPVPFDQLFFLKFIEVAFLSSWAFLFMSLPLFIAYGLVKDISITRYVCSIVLILIPFILVSSSLGFILALFLSFLSKIRGKIFIATGMLFLVLIKIFFTLKTRNTYTHGDIHILFDHLLKHTSWAVNPFNPTAWFTSLFLSLSGESRLPINISFHLVFSSAFFMTAFLLFFHSLFGYRAWTRYQSAGSRRKSWSLFFIIDHIFVKLLKIKRDVASIVARDVQLFFRDPVQYSQFGIFFGILFVYFYNLHNMRYQIDSLFWKNLIIFLNLGSVCLTLATLSTRFLFPQISMEGKGMWVLGMSPFRFRQVLHVKYISFCLFLLCITVPLIITSNSMLNVSGFDFVLTLILVVLATAGLSASSIGLGALFPNFNALTASEAVSGFGGTLSLIVSIAYIVLLIVPCAFVKHADVMGWIGHNTALFILTFLLILNGSGSLFLSYFLLKKGGEAIEKNEC